MFTTKMIDLALLHHDMKDEKTSSTKRTLLYSIRAHARGKVHMKKTMKCFGVYGVPQKEEFSFEDQANFIGDRWKLYIRPEALAA